MADFIVQLFKTSPLSNRQWSNTYQISASDLTDAATAVTILGTFEAARHSAETLVTYARVSTKAVGDHSYTTVPLNLAGTSGLTSPPVPLFNTIRIDVIGLGFGAPSRMHYRTLREDDITGNVIDATRVSTFVTAFNTLIADLSANGTPAQQDDGDPWDHASCDGFVHQRSLHRKRRKPVTP